ncbi:META domain-containing protein [Marinobacterium arenosum]|uniref:META domain-containing protein n=1 Tax=Marinobacterium arenosum TaxID=2862496 RepID=UPI001C96BCA0|nr:META domain-containing protein [Marinobacterium arenosum]MBY4678711.1 META domain-containing protein [Marinobacterium arenosum]
MIALASVLVACGTAVKPTASLSADYRVTYGDVSRLPANAELILHFKDSAGNDLAAPDVRLLQRLPSGFQLPVTLADRAGSITVEAALRLNGQPIATGSLMVTAGRDNHLQLLPSQNESRLGALAGTQWRLLSVNGRNALEFVDATLSFGSDGLLRGSGGCNRYVASYAHRGSLINIDEISSSRKICFAAVMYQEHNLLKMLRDLERVERDGQQLLLYSRGLDQPARLQSATRLLGSAG